MDVNAVETHKGIHDQLELLFSPSNTFHVVYFLQKVDPEENVRELRREGDVVPPIESRQALAGLAEFCKSCGEFSLCFLSFIQSFFARRIV